VELKVFDLLGREVRTLIKESQNAGIHSVMFDGNNLPSGVYFYRLQAGTYSNTKKLLLLK
jgi:flagellar hook assembly protein FlgD